MSEQPGPAAGTAEPNPPSNSNQSFNQPWSISDYDPRVILDANGEMVALTVDSPFNEAPRPAAVESARYIVACANFCKDIPDELLEMIDDGIFKITATRLPEGQFEELAADGMVVSTGAR